MEILLSIEKFICITNNAIFDKIMEMHIYTDYEVHSYDVVDM